MEHDPFFSVGPDPNWNACIGQQADEENYADGFIKAAVELINALFEKGQYDKRDTLVLPILYNSRHAIELALKMAIGELVDMGIIPEAYPKNHDILGHYKFLQGARLGDELLAEILSKLEPFVTSLSQIDEDGQELRYHENRDGKRSLDEHGITSLIIIRDSLAALQKVLGELKRRLRELRFERQGGFFLPDLSRRDLIEIAKKLPDRANWGDLRFDDIREALTTRFGIGNREYSEALNLIQKKSRGAAVDWYRVGIAELD